MATKHIADAEGCFTIFNVTPDFCIVGGSVIPFDISRTLKPEKSNYAKSVLARGEKTLTIQSIIAGVDGNAGEGVKSGVSLGDGNSQVQEGSGSVFIEGKKAARHGDEVEMNGVFAPAPAGQGNPSGLGGSADRLIEQSPTLQADLERLKREGWVVEYGPEGAGSFANRELKTITLDGALRADPMQATQVLSHEVGHACYPYQADMSSRAAYVNGALADEGAATMKNIQVQREIIANGGPDIGLAGNAANHAGYNNAFDQYQRTNDAAQARAEIGRLFGNGERTSTTGQTYAEYYGSFFN
jgi:type VI secretion system secreted protein VgrG